MTVAERPSRPFGITVLKDETHWTESLPLAGTIFSSTAAVAVERPEKILRKSPKHAN